MAADTHYTANTELCQIATANSNMDGTGTLGTVVTASSNGTLVKTVTIKAIVDTIPGMIRFFIYNGSITKLIMEVPVPYTTKSSRDSAFEVTIPLDLLLESGDVLKASTQNAQTFNIIAEALDYEYYASVRPESTNYIANTGIATISTANSSLTGSGTLGTVLTADHNGTLIDSITIKALESTEPGMIRLFINNGGLVTRLLTEIPVPYVTQTSIANSFSHRIDFNGMGFALEDNYVLKASTENAESFNVIAEGLDWEYPA